MDCFKRVKMLRAMETIVRSINDEEIIEAWLMNGIADGDGDEDDEYLFDMYGSDDTFADIMACFCRVMRYAVEDEEIDKDERMKGNVILYCDDVVSKKQEYEVPKPDTNFRTEDNIW